MNIIDETYLSTVKKYPALSNKEQVELLKKYKSGDSAAYEKLVLHNQGLVLKTASKYKGLFKTYDFMDLVQCANIGLIKAIKDYDIEKGFAFSTYAVEAMRNTIMKETDNYDLSIRIPAYLCAAERKIKTAKLEYEAKNGREPNIDELKKLTNLPGNIINTAKNKYKEISMDTCTTNDDADTSGLYEYLISDINVEEDAIKNQGPNFWDAIDDFLEFMEKRESQQERQKEMKRDIKIFKDRIGYRERPILSCRKCAEKYDMTQQNVKNIEYKFIRYLKNPKYNRKIKEYNSWIRQQ